MKVFTKSLFLITLGFNSFFIKESEASVSAVRAARRQATEQAKIQPQPIVQQPQEVEQRSEEVEQQQQLVGLAGRNELADRNLFNNNADQGLEVNTIVAITLKPIIERVNNIQNEQQQQWLYIQDNLGALRTLFYEKLNPLTGRMILLESKQQQLVLDNAAKVASMLEPAMEIMNGIQNKQQELMAVNINLTRGMDSLERRITDLENFLRGNINIGHQLEVRELDNIEEQHNPENHTIYTYFLDISKSLKEKLTLKNTGIAGAAVVTSFVSYHFIRELFDRK